MFNEQERKKLLEKIHSADCPEELHSAYRLGLFTGYGEGLQQAKEDALPKLSEEEQAYRRGFAHGFQVGRKNSVLTDWDIAAWRNSKVQKGAPGTPFENTIFNA